MGKTAFSIKRCAAAKKCGIDISEYISRRSSERVKLGPGTLYALLSEFEQEGL